MSLLAKTLHRPAIRGGFLDCSASSPNSPSMETPIRLACWSRKEPVPAAQMLFMAKSSRRLALAPLAPAFLPQASLPTAASRRLATAGAAPSAFESTMSLESSPPISMIERTCGYKAATEAHWAMISLTK